MDIGNEDTLYQQLADSATTLVSTGHPPSILKCHSPVLELKGDGLWQLHSAADYRVTLETAIQ